MSRNFAVSIQQLKPQKFNQFINNKLTQKNNHKYTLFIFPCTQLTQISRTSSSFINNPNKITKNLNFNKNHINSFNILDSFPVQRSLWFSVMSQNNDDGLITAQESTKTVRCVIKGRVQGVFYRNWTIENAIQLGLKGWVRNRRDGSVEALFSGKTEVVDDMMQRCRRGPPDAMVTAFQANPCNEDPGTSFERRPTV